MQVFKAKYNSVQVVAVKCLRDGAILPCLHCNVPGSPQETSRLTCTFKTQEAIPALSEQSLQQPVAAWQTLAERM